MDGIEASMGTGGRLDRPFCRVNICPLALCHHRLASFPHETYIIYYCSCAYSVASKTKCSKQSLLVLLNAKLFEIVATKFKIVDKT